MATTGDVAINPALFKNIPYDVDRDLAPITTVSDAPMVLATNGESTYRTVAEVIAAARAAARRTRCRHARLRQHKPAGAGIDRARYRHQIRARAVQGRQPGRAGAGGGRYPARDAGKLVGCAALPSGQHPRPGGDDGQALAAQPGMADAASEAGVQETINASNWTALLAPKGTPQPIIDKLNAEGRRNPRHARCEGAVRRRRRRRPFPRARPNSMPASSAKWRSIA